MTHKEMTAHIRNRIKKAGILAKCRMESDCGRKTIHINLPTYDSSFSEEECKTIRLIARVNGLTGSNKSPIEENAVYVSRVFVFEFWGDK